VMIVQVSTTPPVARSVPVYGRETPICAYAAMGIWPI
jgi:hypothetical protein